MKPWIYAFTLMITLCLAVIALAQTVGTLSYGDTVTGTITNDDPIHEWTFEGAAGDVIHIQMVATNLSDGGLDSYLLLLDAAGDVLAENDDASDLTINAAIEGFELPADGSYTIQATRFGFASGLVTGEYELTLNLADAPEDDSAEEEPPADGDFGYDQVVTGTLNRNHVEDAWRFTGTAGEVITVRMERTDGDLDTFLLLLDDQENELARNDDADNSTSVSEITGFRLPYSGEYTVIATRYGFESGTSGGEYTLVIRTQAEEATPEPESPTPTPTPTLSPPPPTPSTSPSAFPEEDFPTIRYGDFISEGLSTGDEVDFYQFEGQAGDVVTISVKRIGEDINPAVGLLDKDTNILEVNLDFNGPADARIRRYVLPTDDTYIVSVLAQNEVAGSYVLHLFAEDIPASSLPPAPSAVPPRVGVSDAELDITLVWDGEADFDLAVTAPDGIRLDYAVTHAGGGTFGGDANGGCAQPQAQPAESVFWESTAPRGTYQIEVAYVFPCGVVDAVGFTLTIQQNGVILETITGELTEGNFEIYDYTLD